MGSEDEEIIKQILNFGKEYKDIISEKLPGPLITKIPTPEPHCLISDIYLNKKDWYDLCDLIDSFADEAHKSYNFGLFYASIASSIMCVEYTLKYEYLRKIAKVEQNEKTKERSFTLGFFTKEKSRNLRTIIKNEDLIKKIILLNHIRNAMFHFNPEKIKNVANSYKSLESFNNPLISEPSSLILANYTYNIMNGVLDYFYGKNKENEYLKEAIKDFENNKEKIKGKVKQQITGEDFEVYFENKIKYMKEISDDYKRIKNEKE
jgi:hypothetical protein